MHTLINLITIIIIVDNMQQFAASYSKRKEEAKPKVKVPSALSKDGMYILKFIVYSIL